MEFYHVLNRGVDKRNIFINDRDRFRFIHDLFEFNNNKVIETSSRKFTSTNMSDIGCRTLVKQPRELLVNICAFCLMPNHYHLMISPRVTGGISKFMHKLNMGYTKYFNIKYDRQGALFQGKYKHVLIERDNQFTYLPHYIHLNPLDLEAPEWRNGRLNNPKEAHRFLKSYRWSSLLDYSGIDNFPSILNKKILDKLLTQQKICDTKDWIRELNINDSIIIE